MRVRGVKGASEGEAQPARRTGDEDRLPRKMAHAREHGVDCRARKQVDFGFATLDPASRLDLPSSSSPGRSEPKNKLICSCPYDGPALSECQKRTLLIGISAVGLTNHEVQQYDCCLPYPASSNRHLPVQIRY